jgi:hypothetical protein
MSTGLRCQISLSLVERRDVLTGVSVVEFSENDVKILRSWAMDLSLNLAQRVAADRTVASKHLEWGNEEVDRKSIARAATLRSCAAPETPTLSCTYPGKKDLAFRRRGLDKTAGQT